MSPFVEFTSQELFASWTETVNTAEEQFLDTLLLGLADKLIDIEYEFWEMLGSLAKTTDTEEFMKWWVKIICHLEKEEIKTIDRKRKKLRKLLKDDNEKMRIALKRFDEHLENFDFKLFLKRYGRELSPDMDNLICLVSLGDVNNLDKSVPQEEEQQIIQE